MNDFLRNAAVARALYIAAPLLLVLSLVGLATVDTSDDKPNVAAGVSNDSTATTLASGAPAPQPGVAGTATTIAAGAAGKAGPATTQGRNAPGPTVAGGAPSPIVPGPTKPPTDGTYKYRFTGSQPGSQGTEDSGSRDVDIAVKTTGRSGNEIRQTATFKNDDVTATTRWVWSPSSWIEEGSAFATQGMDFDCTWKPPVVKVKLEVAQGAKWEVDSVCTITTPQGTIQTQRVEHAEVTGVERTAVAGKSVDVWVIARRGTVTTKASGGAFGERTFGTMFTGKELFSSARGLTVRVTGSSKSSEGDSSDKPFSQELLSLDPS